MTAISHCVFAARREFSPVEGERNLFILKPLKAWVDRGHKERRTIHHNGDGTFVVDGRVLNTQEEDGKMA